MPLDFMGPAVIAIQAIHQREHHIPLVSPAFGVIGGITAFFAAAMQAPTWISILAPLLASGTPILIAVINKRGNAEQWKRRYRELVEQETHKAYAREQVDRGKDGTIKALQDELSQLRSQVSQSFKEPKD